jgi:hypothetical protein
MPKPTLETWKMIKMSILDCKSVESINLAEYLKLSKEIRDLKINARLLTNEVINGINLSKLNVLSIQINENQDISKFINLV